MTRTLVDVLELVGISVDVNGQRYDRKVEPRTLLVHFLRDDLFLTGTHIGCETSVCGACAVLVDGILTKSCTFLAVQADGRSITTIEGVAKNQKLHPVQEKLWKCHGVQCGYCTSGMVMAIISLLSQEPNPSDGQIREALKGNLCRCTGYSTIVQAVHEAANVGNNF